MHPLTHCSSRPRDKRSSGTYVLVMVNAACRTNVNLLVVSLRIGDVLSCSGLANRLFY
jgi:hypothetical protein